MKIDDEMLMAYADGELEPADAARVAASIAADPALGARLERHRALRARLAAGFAGVLEEPVPERLLAAARGEDASGGVADIRDATARREARGPRRWSWPEWSAMAASLLLGVLVVQWFHARDRGGGELVAGADGALRARAHLAAALDTHLASAPQDGPVEIGISFRAVDGSYCRSFALKGERVLAGLACRDGAGWQVPVASEVATAPGGELRQASTSLPAAVLAELEVRLDGEPLDAEGERAARDAGWR
ncbi:anti-sigma factor family protein [Luteimonas suaedae]|uniref:anti-sigma factor family protein n=1 Tax=Luteimonas suaedae TaxID=2605430 RepID=UPI0011EF2CE5|nr:hypothetical protein [Luteimonas suaedae]